MILYQISLLLLFIADKRTKLKILSLLWSLKSDPSTNWWWDNKI